MALSENIRLEKQNIEYVILINSVSYYITTHEVMFNLYRFHFVNKNAYFMEKVN